MINSCRLVSDRANDRFGGRCHGNFSFREELGKRNLFIYALIFSGGVNALFAFVGPEDIGAIFTIGIVSEFASAIFPTFSLSCWAMLPITPNSKMAEGNRTHLFRGFVCDKVRGRNCGCDNRSGLGAFRLQRPGCRIDTGSCSRDQDADELGACIITVCGSGLMFFYPLTQKKLDEITTGVKQRRLQE